MAKTEKHVGSVGVSPTVAVKKTEKCFLVLIKDPQLFQIVIISDGLMGPEMNQDGSNFF